MKHTKLFSATLAFVLLLTACGTSQNDPANNPAAPSSDESPADAVEISLSDTGIKVDGSEVQTGAENAVYVGNDIIYYENGKDFTYGEGTTQDAHSSESAAEHTVVHITQPGTYSISGTLSKGQIAVDLGDEAENDPDAVVTLILNGADITCTVAPAIIFYNVYECGTTEADAASEDIDTSSAGANVVIADGTQNTVNGSYVARIYKPDSVVLNEAGTEVEDAKKLHKYDGAFYSKMSMNVTGGPESSGVLTINADNEGLGSELHLTINGGIIHINSGNDGINTNEDGVSVTTVNDGELHIRVTGETGEGDGIDSNGWLVINGGTVTAQACDLSMDAGIDSDMGIHINGGTVIATGQMLDRIENGGQNYAVFSFAQKQSGADTVYMKDDAGNSVMEFCPNNGYSIMIYSSPKLTAGTYTLWSNEAQLAGMAGGMMGGPGSMGMAPDGFTPPEFAEGTPSDGTQPPEGLTPPDGMTPPEGFDGQQPPEPPDGMEFPGDGGWNGGRPNGPRDPNSRNEEMAQELDSEFFIAEGMNMFQGVSPIA